MSLTDAAINQWTFSGVTFARVSGANPWFTEEAVLTVEPVLDSEGSPYVDKGGVIRTELSVRAAFETDGAGAATAKRDTMVAKRATTARLANGRGKSAKVVLKSATPVASEDGYYAYVDCTFIWVGA